MAISDSFCIDQNQEIYCNRNFVVISSSPRTAYFKELTRPVERALVVFGESCWIELQSSMSTYDVIKFYILEFLSSFFFFFLNKITENHLHHIMDKRKIPVVPPPGGVLTEITPG